MKDGAVVSIFPAGDVSERNLFLAMGGEVAPAKTSDAGKMPSSRGSRPVAVRIPMTNVNGAATEIFACEGEVIGLAGIAGQGQEQVLDRLWRGKRGDVEVGAARAYVPGDRQRSGILPLWDVAANLTISALSGLSRRGIRQVDAENSLVTRWVELLKIRGGAHAAVTGLSGEFFEALLFGIAKGFEPSTFGSAVSLGVNGGGTHLVMTKQSTCRFIVKDLSGLGCGGMAKLIRRPFGQFCLRITASLLEGFPAILDSGIYSSTVTAGIVALTGLFLGGCLAV
jgi:hypothetical protein